MAAGANLQHVKFIDDLVGKVLDRLVPLVDKRMQELGDNALKMIADELPIIAGKVAESAIKVVFANTHIDEAATDISDVISGILGRIPFLLPGNERPNP